MFDLYADLDCDAKRAKLADLRAVYEALAMGQQHASITDDRTGSVSYSRADLNRLERLILGLQNSIAACCDNTPRRRAIGIVYGH